MFQKLTMCFSKRFPLIMNNQNPHCWTFLQDWRHMSDGESDTAWNNTQYVFTEHFKNKLKKWIPLAESNIQLNLAKSNLLYSKNLFRTNYLFSLKKTSKCISKWDKNEFTVFESKHCISTNLIFLGKYLCNSKWIYFNLYNSKFSIHNLCVSKGVDLQDKPPHELDASWLAIHLDLYISNSIHLNLHISKPSYSKIPVIKQNSIHFKF